MKNKKEIKKPNFFIVGAPRCGTTTLYSILKKHPDIYMSEIKEPNFFCDDKLDKKISNWEKYLGLFKNAKNEKIIGESSVKYLYSKKSALRIKDKIGKPKILIQLRNPVDRAISHYRWKKRAEKEPLNFKYALEKERERIGQGWPNSYHYFQTGLYYQQVKRFIDAFGEKNVKITIFEKFIKNPQKVLKEIYEFLEIDTNFIPNKTPHYGTSNKIILKELNRIMGAKTPILKIIKKIVPIKIRKKIIYLVRDNLNASSFQIEIDFSEQDRINLYKKFLPNVKKLENLIQKDLSIWHNDKK